MKSDYRVLRFKQWYQTIQPVEELLLYKDTYMALAVNYWEAMLMVFSLR